MANQKRQLTIRVKGKSPNTVEISLTEAVVTEEGGIKDVHSTTTDDDFAIGTALYETIALRLVDFIKSLQQDEGPTLFDSGKNAKADAGA